jgi:hypothetical protein
LNNGFVAVNIALDLRYPVPRVVAASEHFLSLGPISTVPEIAVTKDGYLARDECDVGAPRKRRRAYPISRA